MWPLCQSSCWLTERKSQSLHPATLVRFYIRFSLRLTQGYLHDHYSVYKLEENAEIHSIRTKDGLWIIHSLTKMSEITCLFNVTTVKLKQFSILIVTHYFNT